PPTSTLFPYTTLFRSYQHLTVQPQPPSTLNPVLSKDVEGVLLKALKKKPEERFMSISAFANAFRQALQSTDASTIVRTLHIPERDRKSTRLNSSHLGT